MISTVSMIELNQIIDAVHGDPHNILGMHEVEIGGRAALAVRAFIPQAKKITVLDPADASYQYELEKIHIDGFFESILPERTKWFRYRYKIEGHEGNVWETYDPYSFQPQISDLDMHLFGEGTHYEIFNKLGAHLKTLDGVDGVAFAVWAPSAVRVSVIGQFNNWDGRRGQMRKLAQSGIWEIFIPGLAAGDQYKFEIRTFEGAFIEKSDPYGFFAELRPSTTSLVYDIEKYIWQDQKWFKNRAAKNPLAGPMTIYELHLGSWRSGMESERVLNYTELADELIPYVKKMGYTHIELMPVMEHPFDGTWGYQATGFFAPTSRYGTPEEFMAFIDRCHQNQIGVLLDFAAARFPKDAHGLAKFDGTPLYEPDDPRRAENVEWGALSFNYGRKQVKNFLIASALFWIEKYHIDGLRMDALSSMLYLNYGKADGQWVPNQYGGAENLDAVEFIKHMNAIVSEREPSALMIAEESSAWENVTKPVTDGGLGFSMKWNKSFMNDFLAYVKQDPIFRRYHHNNLTYGLVYAYTEKYLLSLSHEELVRGKQSMLDKMPGELWEKCANLRVAYAFLYGHPGKKLMFMGSEFGQFTEWDEKRGLDWFLLDYDHHKQIKQYVNDLNVLYKKERAFWFDDFEGNGFEWINCNDAERSVVSFIRKSDNSEETLIFICNFTPNVIQSYKFGLPFSGFYKEIFNSDAKKYGGNGITNDLVLKAEPTVKDDRAYSVTLSLPALGAVILKPEK